MLKHSPDTQFLDWKVQNTEHHLQKLIRVIPWQRYKSSNRMVCSLGTSYSYSGHTTKGHSFDIYPPLKALIERVNKELGTNFNSVLLNWYPANNTRVGINFHQDNEPEIKRGSPVLSISLGESTEFVLKAIDNSELITVELKDGDVFLMGTNSQLNYLHSIPYKVMKKDRISLTLREFI